MAVPAIVYVIQNNLSFFALGNLDPATYQVTYQLKLLTTALVMRLLLGKILTSKQWGALFVLLIGVCLVEIEKLAPQDMTAVSRQMLQTASANKKDDSVIGEERSYDSPAGSSVNVLAGIAATIGMTFCSAFAGVYFEKMVRSSPASSSGGKGLQQGAIKLSELGELWVKNIQLYLFSCISALAACLLHDGDKIAENGFFHGYNSLTVVVVLIGSAGGTATALMLKYLDNIYKNFASSMSLVLASFCSFCLTGQLYGPKFFLGSFLVCLSLFIYQSTQKTLTNKTTVGSNSANRQRNLPLPMYMPKEVISKVMEQNDVSKA
ncbi:CMP-sialic acid transporter-like isoform X2 [Symsagittifera roscoffensis]